MKKQKACLSLMLLERYRRWEGLSRYREDKAKSHFKNAFSTSTSPRDRSYRPAESPQTHWKGCLRPMRCLSPKGERDRKNVVTGELNMPDTALVMTPLQSITSVQSPPTRTGGRATQGFKRHLASDRAPQIHCQESLPVYSQPEQHWHPYKSRNSDW